MLFHHSVILTVCVTWVVAIRQPNGGPRGLGLNRNDFVAEGEEMENPLKKEEFVKDKGHFLEHLKDRLQIDEGQLDDLSEGESNFIFFKSHDFNNDDKLDGLELYQSILHGLEEFFEDVDDANEKIKTVTTSVMLQRLVMAVDKILQEDDRDRDGYLSYDEFARARLASESLKDFNGIKGHA